LFARSNVMVWLSRQEEKKVMELCKSHLNKIVETVKAMKEVVYAFCNEDFNALEEYYKKAFDTERSADDIKHTILVDVSKGSLHPIDREEVIRFVLTADDIAENAKSASGKLRLSSTGCLTDDIKVNLKEMADRDVAIVEKLNMAFDKLNESTDAAIEMSEQVEIIEESIDEFRLGLIKQVMDCKVQVISIKDLGPWLMLLNAIENMEEVSDRSEDTADVIRSIAILR
jgi:predicted phosphate transport protein (TIGR00153 family)